MICRNRTGFKNSHLSVFMPIRRKNIIHFSTHFLVIVCFVFERREFFHPERRNIERFHQFKCLFIKAVRFFISTEKYISLIHISEPTRLGMISYAVFCLKKKNTSHNKNT